ncbi:MAG: thymidine kinase [Verrucomicrobia bacterium TMED56]|nr:MAG: thymidine kinase [Verrucomicrobia bacterium TMED56]
MAKLHFYYSSMNAGKSTALLQANHNYGERGMRTLLFTAGIDDRAGFGVISSRIGIEIQAIAFDKSDKLCTRLNEEFKNGHIDCILVDEAQFLSRQQVKELASIVDQKNIPVLAYGLRTDFMGESFEGSQYLLAWADEIREIKAICHCGKKATMNARIGESGEIERAGEQIEIGGNERYVSLCRKCFSEGISGE